MAQVQCGLVGVRPLIQNFRSKLRTVIHTNRFRQAAIPSNLLQDVHDTVARQTPPFLTAVHTLVDLGKPTC